MTLLLIFSLLSWCQKGKRAALKLSLDRPTVCHRKANKICSEHRRSADIFITNKSGDCHGINYDFMMFTLPRTLARTQIFGGMLFFRVRRSLYTQTRHKQCLMV